MFRKTTPSRVAGYRKKDTSKMKCMQIEWSREIKGLADLDNVSHLKKLFFSSKEFLSAEDELDRNIKVKVKRLFGKL